MAGGSLFYGRETSEAVVEPQPEPRLLAEVPGMADELRRPMMLLVKAVKAV